MNDQRIERAEAKARELWPCVQVIDVPDGSKKIAFGKDSLEWQIVRPKDGIDEASWGSLIRNHRTVLSM